MISIWVLFSFTTAEKVTRGHFNFSQWKCSKTENKLMLCFAFNVAAVLWCTFACGATFQVACICFLENFPKFFYRLSRPLLSFHVISGWLDDVEIGDLWGPQHLLQHSLFIFWLKMVFLYSNFAQCGSIALSKASIHASVHLSCGMLLFLFLYRNYYFFNCYLLTWLG